MSIFWDRQGWRPLRCADLHATDMTANTDRFEFGENWSKYLATVDEERIQRAEQSMRTLLGVDDLKGKRFLDAGSGSGMFSLAAHHLGATVCSFDFDKQSVACTEALRKRYAGPDDRSWEVKDGSLLDPEFMATLGSFDIVYCWGVAHHTGAMWDAIANLVSVVAEGGVLALAIYNDQGDVSEKWKKAKQLYQRLPPAGKRLQVLCIGAYWELARIASMVFSVVRRVLMLRNPWVPIQIYIDEKRHRDTRGMNRWHDLVDWVGGWPFEVAKPEEVFRFLRDRDFQLCDMTTSRGHGCNEFVLRKTRGLDRVHS